MADRAESDAKLAEQKATTRQDKQAERPQQKQAEREAAAPSEPSPRQVEEAYRRDDYAEALSLADRYLRSSDLSQLQKARVLELKARALEALGRTAEAHTVYTTLRRSHRSYKSDEIDRARRRTDTTRSKSSGDSTPKPADKAASESPQMMAE